MSNCVKYKFSYKLLKTGFLANDQWQQSPGFDAVMESKCQAQHKIRLNCSLI